MSNPGEGGFYIRNADGERVLVERTNWTPPAAPEPEVESEPVTHELEDKDDVLS